MSQNRQAERDANRNVNMIKVRVSSVKSRCPWICLSVLPSKEIQANGDENKASSGIAMRNIAKMAVKDQSFGFVNHVEVQLASVVMKHELQSWAGDSTKLF